MIFWRETCPITQTIGASLAPDKMVFVSRVLPFCLCLSSCNSVSCNEVLLCAFSWKKLKLSLGEIHKQNGFSFATKQRRSQNCRNFLQTCDTSKYDKS